jgi:two-component system, cell cycle sensor histidine kinase and response regulator CckA
MDQHDDSSAVGTATAPNDIGALRTRVENYERWFRTMDGQIRLLEEDRQKLQGLVENTDAGVLLLDPQGKVTWTNAVYRDHFGAQGPSSREPTGLSCHQALCRKGSTCDACPHEKAVREGKVAHHELSLLIGERFHHVYATACPVRSLDGNVEQAFVLLQDLSDLTVLRRSEEALRSTEERFRSIFEQAGAGMATFRADGSFLQVNPIFCTMVGYTESELLRKKFIDLIHFEDQSEASRNFAEVRAGRRRVIEMELRYVRRDSTSLWCHVTSVWQFDRKNTPTYSVALVQDISHRKRAELALDQSQKRYEALLNSIDGIVWEADSKAFRFSFVSNQAERMLGYPVDKWLSQPRFWRNKIHPEDLERVTQSLAGAVENKRNHELEYRMLGADGRTVWMRDTVSLVIEQGKVAKLRGLMVDVTDKKEAEMALLQSEEQLRQSQKMEAIGRLAGGIAHDFNNLLTAITGYGDLLIRGLGEDHRLRREALEISKAAKRAADLTGQLLAFSRQQVLQPKVLLLKDVVVDMEMMLRRVIGEHITLVTRVDSPLGAVRADPGQLHQVILNLSVNARDAMAEGGELTIETADADFDEAWAVRHSGVTPGPYVMLAVSDTGCGMDDATKARLFEPFFTTKEQGKGTGLGLSTVYGIVKQSGGHISVESSSGVGSTFRIFLPRVAVASVEAPPKKETIPDTSPGTEHILLVEDDDAVRELAREVLEMNGYTVVEAPNGVEALAMFEPLAETIDLVVTDLVMPQLGGRELAKKISARRSDLRVLYLSGYTDSVAMQQGMLDPGSSFLQKPFTPAELARKVRTVLDG